MVPLVPPVFLIGEPMEYGQSPFHQQLVVGEA